MSSISCWCLCGVLLLSSLVTAAVLLKLLLCRGSAIVPITCIYTKSHVDTIGGNTYNAAPFLYRC